MRRIIFVMLLIFPLAAEAQPVRPPFYVDKTNLLVYLDAAGTSFPVKTPADWQKRREHILANMQLVMGPLPPNSQKVPLDVYAGGFVSATMKGIFNHMCAVDLLQGLPEVDGARIGCIGHSLGGHNSLFVATFEPRLKVIVSSCGFNSFKFYSGGNLTGWSHKGYMPRIASEYQKDPKLMPFDFTEILGALAPRAVYINAPLKDSNFPVAGVKVCVAAAEPVYRLHGAAANLEAAYPNAGHDFPPDIREKAYAFIDRHLR